MNRLSFLTILFLTLSCNLILVGQTEGIETDQVEVFKSFDANLEDAQKVGIVPKLPKINPIKKVYDYKITILPLAIKYPDPLIKPLAMPADESFESFDFFAKLGYGNVKNPFAKLVYSTRDNYKYDLSVNLNHYGIDNSIKNPIQKMAHSFGQVAGKYRVKENMQIHGNINVDRQDRQFYQLDSALFNRVSWASSIAIGVNNVEETESGINYDGTISFNTQVMNDFGNGVKEGTIALNGEATKRINKKLRIELPLHASIVDNAVNHEKLSLFTFSASPVANFHIGKFSAIAGGSFILDGEDGMKIYPKLSIAYGVLGNYVQVFADADQYVFTNSLYQLAKEVPYIQAVFPDLKNSLVRSISGGIRGEFSFLTYQGRAGYKTIISQAFYQNNEGFGSRPALIFDDANAIFVSGNIEFAVAKNVRVGGTATNNFYDLTTLEKPFGVPSLDLDAYSKFFFWEQRLSFHADLHIADRTHALVVTSNTSDVIALNNQVELNAGLEFWPIKNVGIYLDANNILDNNYARFYGIPAVGIHFAGGAVVKF